MSGILLSLSWVISDDVMKMEIALVPAPHLSLDRALEQGCDDLALEKHEDEKGGYQD
jgi:hypothetical protein